MIIVAFQEKRGKEGEYWEKNEKKWKNEKQKSDTVTQMDLFINTTTIYLQSRGVFSQVAIYKVI